MIKLKIILTLIISACFVINTVPVIGGQSFLAPPSSINMTKAPLTERDLFICYLHNYLKVEDSGMNIKVFQDVDDEIINKLLTFKDKGIDILMEILHSEKKACIRAKTVVALGQVYLKNPNEAIIKILIEQSLNDNSVLVKSLIKRLVFRKWILPTIIDNNFLLSLVKENLNEIDLNPWPKRGVLRVLDVGCECGEGTFGMLEHYTTKEDIIDIAAVGVDQSMRVIIEAEKRRSEKGDEKNVIFVYGNTDNDIIGPVDIVISQNLLIYKNELVKHADSLINQINSDGGTIFFTPSIWNADIDSSGEDAIKRL